MKDFWLKWRREIVRGAILFTTVVVVGLLVISWVNRGISSIPRRFGLNFNSDFDTDFPGMGPGRLVADTWSIHARVPAGQWVWIHNTNGPIRVEPGRGDSVQILGIKSYRHSDPTSVKVIADHNGAGLTVCALWGQHATQCAPGSEWKPTTMKGNDVAIEFVVRLPRGVALGATTVNGSVHVVDASAPVVGVSVNGGVDARTAKGPVRAISVNGPVHASMQAFGDTGEVNVVTVNGSATVELPERLDADLDVSTVNGNISSDYPITVEGRFVGKKLQGRVGAGGRHIQVTVVNGSITLLKAGQDSTGIAPPRRARSAHRSAS
ncbi:MAG: hypothetical protein DMD37_11725 [Gemmatimonadetes bacterium]|nr:MAG: hypothetical protein DMD37_11725 [Gemmatimonadota bacterium]